LVLRGQMPGRLNTWPDGAVHDPRGIKRPVKDRPTGRSGEGRMVADDIDYSSGRLSLCIQLAGDQAVEH
jgi:hypothetical protein